MFITLVSHQYINQMYQMIYTYNNNLVFIRIHDVEINKSIYERPIR